MASQRRLYRRILDQMLILIDSGEFPVGGRLPPERELAERFKVSRPTVREAIIALEARGRVEVKTGSGIYVLPFNSGGDRYDASISAYELTEARALIEGEAAALAAVQSGDYSSLPPLLAAHLADLQAKAAMLSQTEGMRRQEELMRKEQELQQM